MQSTPNYLFLRKDLLGSCLCVSYNYENHLFITGFFFKCKEDTSDRLFTGVTYLF
jgi:hypothetical protein